MPVAPIPVAPGPVVAGRLIPQALPGSPCEPGVECTGGSVCSLGICVCPPELVQEGTVCISRTIYSVIPPPPPAVIVPAIPAVPVAAPLALGAPCYAAPTPCVSGAVCSAGVCQCSPAYTPVAGGCVRRMNAQGNCNSAPTEALRIICGQIAAWDANAKTVATPSNQRTLVQSPGGAGAGLSGGSALSASAAPTNAYECMDIACLCGFFGGSGGSNCVLRNGQRLGKALRKEYRVMTDVERNRYHTAMWTIKGNGDYDQLSRIHSSFTTSPGAHSGPAFLPWHREFIKSEICEMTTIIRSIWIGQRIPDSWRHAIIIPFHKKLSVMDPRNYRGISLLRVMYKHHQYAPLTDLEYADDVVIFAEGSTKLQHVINLVSKLAAAYGLR
ncbi:hypothetical protein RB195_012197 [Necator americanus]|uniref:EB domain-containing protein n=1 Tax=Necator americanus TaxID=51031 RepID=A0ABR1D601_NECAM